MALKNYTSTVPASKSISLIEAKLVSHGARKIQKQYNDEGVLTGMCFIVSFNGAELPYKLPARVTECEQKLRASLSSRTRPETIKKITAQAERTAWKILLDWVEAQMAMIEMAQVELIEVFLPYLYHYEKDKTYFEIVKDSGLQKLLPATPKDE